MPDSIPLIVAILSFGTVSAVAFLVGQYVWAQSRIQRRLSLLTPASTLTRARPRTLDAFVAKHFDVKRFGLDDSLRGKLRRELVQAGYFKSDAVNYYIFARFAVVIILPLLSYIVVETFLPGLGQLLKLAVVSISAAVRRASNISLGPMPASASKPISPAVWLSAWRTVMRALPA